MGIRVYESEEMFSDEDSNTCCSCSSCHKSTITTTAASNNVNVPSSPSNVNHMQSGLYMTNIAYKDIVGNCKEVRIEENTSNLRIVGNNNRIRITLNTGDIIVIGNNTRLKIQTNHGHIKYTGNDGRIKLGNQSQQQLVDYIGCNGTLKIVNSKKFSKSKCAAPGHNATVSNNTNKSPTEVKSSTKQVCRNSKSKEKSHSYGGSSSPRDQAQWQTFNTLFNHSAPKSMPNLTSTQYETRAHCDPEPALRSGIQNIGNIVIANASNICIAPFARNVTMKA